MVIFKNYEQIFPICEKKHERDRLNSKDEVTSLMY